MLIASNHQSFLDPVLIGVAIPRPTTFMARSTLFRFAPFGRLLRSVKAFPVKRGRADLGAVREAISRLRAGWALLVFPEGTRTRDGRIQPLRAGFDMLSRRAGVPVVPAVVEGAYEAWPRQNLLPRPCAICVAFGRPIWPDQHRNEQTLRAQVADALRELRAFLKTMRGRALRRDLSEEK